MPSNSSIIGILYLTGEPILLHLLRYSAFVVKDHNFMRCALHLQRDWLVNDPGPPELFRLFYVYFFVRGDI